MPSRKIEAGKVLKLLKICLEYQEQLKIFLGNQNHSNVIKSLLEITKDQIDRLNFVLFNTPIKTQPSWHIDVQTITEFILKFQEAALNQMNIIHGNKIAIEFDFKYLGLRKKDMFPNECIANCENNLHQPQIVPDSTNLERENHFCINQDKFISINSQNTSLFREKQILNNGSNFNSENESSSNHKKIKNMNY